MSRQNKNIKNSPYLRTFPDTKPILEVHTRLQQSNVDNQDVKEPVSSVNSFASTVECTISSVQNEKNDDLDEVEDLELLIGELTNMIIDMKILDL